MKTKEEFKEEIVEGVISHSCLKTVELLRLVKKDRSLPLGLLQEALDELVREGKLMELSYRLGSPACNLHTLIFPAGTTFETTNTYTV